MSERPVYAKPRAGSDGTPRRPVRDSAGGAVSLWVVLMVPVLALAGVAAFAVPQRMAAEATVADTAEDLAALAVAWREGEGVEQREIDAFPPDCDNAITEIRAAQCRDLWEPMFVDLGGLGVDVESVSGFYSDSYATAATPTDKGRPPCLAHFTTVVLDAVHVALVADWYGGWAGSQIWPDGVRLGSEAVGRLNLAFIDEGYDTSARGKPNGCGERMDVVDKYGEPGWLADPEFAGRRMAESVSFRTPFGTLRDPAGDTG